MIGEVFVLPGKFKCGHLGHQGTGLVHPTHDNDDGLELGVGTKKNQTRKQRSTDFALYS